MGYFDKSEILKFAEEYITDYNAQRAMHNLSPHLDENALRVKTSRWLHSEEVWEVIASLIRTKLSPESAGGIVEVKLLKIIHNPRTKDSDIIRACELYCKLKALLTDKLDIKTETIDPKTQEFIDIQLKRLGIEKDS